jgi:ATP-dependent protease ClpP protease subunit
MTQSTSSVRRFWAKKSGSSGSLYLYGDVGGWWGGINAKQITDTLKDLALNGVDELSCYVNSYGGDVFEGFAIYNALKRFDGDVTMYVDGIAASAASLICMAGKSICMSSASMMMIHEASVFNGGTAEDHEAAAAMLAKINESLISVYAARSGESESSVKQMLADETWLTAKEAKSKGFCDQILKDDDDASAEARFTQRAFASASPLLEKYRHVPQSVLARIPAAGPASKVAQRDRNEPKKSKERHMSKKNKASAFTLYKLGLPPDASDADVMEALDNLQERARGADVARAKIEAEARAKAEAT